MVPSLLQRAAGAAALLLALAIGPAAAQETEVDIELVLAVDISRSMDYDEQVIQRNGYADALRHEDVLDAIAAGLIGKISVTYIEWSGPGLQRVVVPWMLVEGKAEAEIFAERLRRAPISRWQGTSVSGALLYAAGRFRDAPFASMRQVIDISGDGPNNMGGPVEPARDYVLEQGITINGLPIMLNRWDPYVNLSIPNLDAYYEACVIGGPGAFMVPVNEPGQFAEAIRRKMVLEIAGDPVSIHRAAELGAHPRVFALPDSMIELAQLQLPVDCLIGEKLRRGGLGP